ncbi:amphi-Trp domain-containing protein [Aliiruegeria sabulilitoris]|uniref:amphi-Trp domain-containing protein n=1 Tax=Aliiruegeria sabulilitoris TaxID=1510458 RepID=UPI000832B0CF|nr:amphi-Trp domain-containing protein [Aliiruegeria sabulilitoris]NDR55508.1 amphi-Trp domain-containing protein [Pseudoruegeria sp. M32A2M]
MKTDGKFRHDSLQTRKTVKTLLEALTKGIGKGELVLSDDDGEITLEPDGLLNLRIRAERADGSNRVDLRITWNDEPGPSESKNAPKVG